jgi:predicted GNAT family acetyltransferase
LLDDRVIGFLTVSRPYETSVEITWTAVRAEHRGHGIGRALVEVPASARASAAG